MSQHLSDKPVDAGQFSLKYKISLCFAILSALVLVLFYLLSRTELSRSLQQQADDLGQALAVQTAESVRELVLANDLLALNVTLSQLSRHPGIRQIQVYNIDNQLISGAGIPGSQPGSPVQDIYRAEISLQDAIAGTVQLRLDTSELSAGIRLWTLYFWGVLVFSLLISVACAFALASHISNPLQNLILALRNPQQAILQEDSKRQDEIALLNNTCLDFLDEYRAHIRRHQPAKATVARAADSPEAARTMASMLVVQVANIGTAIELLQPSTLAGLLDEYYFLLQQSALAHDGEIQRFDGESLMLSFSKPRCGAGHAACAMDCAALFLSLINRVNRHYRSNNAQTLEFRLAIHSGEVYTAPLSAPDQQTVSIGRAVNTAYKLAAKSRPGQLLVSETAWKLAGVAANFSNAEAVEINLSADNMAFMAVIPGDADSEDEENAARARQILEDSGIL